MAFIGSELIYPWKFCEVSCCPATTESGRNEPDIFIIILTKQLLTMEVTDAILHFGGQRPAGNPLNCPGPGEERLK